MAEGRWGPAVTSDYVVAEGLTFVRRKIRRREAEEALLDVVFGRPGAPPLIAAVVRVHGGRFAAALDWFRRTSNRRLSFVDCTTLAVLESARIRHLATFDRGFAGLVPIVGAA